MDETPEQQATDADAAHRAPPPQGPEPAPIGRHHEISAEILLRAPPAHVWHALTDLAAYQAWNPFIPEASVRGKLELGARLKVRIEPPDGGTMTFRPRVVDWEPHQRFAWLGRLVLPGMFDGRHAFHLGAEAEGTRLVQQGTFDGLLVPFFLRDRVDAIQAGLQAMNRALKERVEG